MDVDGQHPGDVSAILMTPQKGERRDVVMDDHPMQQLDEKDEYDERGQEEEERVYFDEQEPEKEYKEATSLQRKSATQPVGGLVGERPLSRTTAGVSLTPLVSLKHANHNFRKCVKLYSSHSVVLTPNSNSFTSMEHTPTNYRKDPKLRDALDPDGRLTHLLNRIACGQASDSHFRKLYRMSKDYLKQRTVDAECAENSIWHCRFAEVVSTLLALLEEPNEVQARMEFSAYL